MEKDQLRLLKGISIIVIVIGFYETVTKYIQKLPSLSDWLLIWIPYKIFPLLSILLLGGILLFLAFLISNYFNLKEKYDNLQDEINELKDFIKNKPSECPHCHSNNVIEDVKQSTSKTHKNELRYRIICNDCSRKFWSYKKLDF